MLVLGITDGQTSGAALVADGQIVAAVNEERLVRVKQARGFPRASIRAVLEMSGVAVHEIMGVAVAQTNMEFRNEIVGWNGWFEERQDLEDSHNLFFNVASKFGSLANKIPASKKLYYAMRKPIYEERRRRIREIMQSEYGVQAPVRFCDHHLAHAASAYYTSGFNEALVITMDGGGDGSSSHVYVGKNGRLENLSKVDSYDSLGNYYAYVTAMCGYKAKRHEGKITGLAAHGRPVYYVVLNSLIACSEGRTVNKGEVLFSAALKKIRTTIGEQFKKEDLAASIQRVSEDVSRDYVDYWVNKTGCRRLALAGGVFANVRINQEVHKLAGVEEIFIHPGMSDEGLAVGAAMTLWAALAHERGVAAAPTSLRDVYLGHEFSQSEMKAALQRTGHAYEYHANIEEQIAALLAAGYVVARFDGRLEYGPRALGNRSILYQPADPSVNDWLNRDLGRTEFMPFAPSTMAEYAQQCFAGTEGAENTARFMTITFDCTDWMKKSCAGVVHRDGTARPQLVRKEDNPGYYRILEKFHKLTRLTSLINTSFNMHEEPIVCTPADAIRAFEQGHLDYLALGNFLLKQAHPLTHPLSPAIKVV
ncbi:MAG TPA: carbamoyltransferase C-terminal domain-containing protein [Candidatus Binatia bacterium]|nr:carbamoyltransferase C-terminal domain-containing protein [Candidatus Binatia bacterium]